MRFHQRLDDADVGEAARATARQHKSDRAAGNEPRQPFNVVGLTGADMVVRLEDAAAQLEMIGKPFAAALRMQEEKLRPARRAFLEGRHIERTQRERLIRTRQ
jgi:hypothetical protein